MFSGCGLFSPTGVCWYGTGQKTPLRPITFSILGKVSHHLVTDSSRGHVGSLVIPRFNPHPSRVWHWDGKGHINVYSLRERGHTPEERMDVAALGPQIRSVRIMAVESRLSRGHTLTEHALWLHNPGRPRDRSRYAATIHALLEYYATTIHAFLECYAATIHTLLECGTETAGLPSWACCEGFVKIHC